MHKGINSTLDEEQTPVVAFSAKDYGADATANLSPTLRAGNSYEGNQNSGAWMAVAFHPTQDPISSTDGTTHAMGCGSKGVQASVAVAIGWDEELNASEEQSGTLLRGGQGGRHDGVMTTAMQVRRLTPIECERLQGFPDNYTAIPWRKKPITECPDGPRYKALGNSWAVPVVRWIGNRIKTEIECKPKK